MINIEYTLVV